MKIQLSRDWSEFLSLLIENGARFLLVGGHAVAAHGEPRLTEGLDLFVEATRDNAIRSRRALVAFGFGEQVPSVEELPVAGRIWMLGRKPWRIDLLTRIDSVSFETAWKGRVEADFATRPLYVIGKKELLANKRAAGRPKDLADVEALESMPAGASVEPRRRPASKGRRRR